MTHVRKQVRDAFKARLAGVSGVNTICGARAHPFGENELPALSVIVSGEIIEQDGREPQTGMRDQSVDVVAYAAGREDVDDVLDAIAAQVETLILASTGEPWDSMYMHDPVAADFNIGEAAENSLFILRTRFSVRFSADDAETIGNPAL